MICSLPFSKGYLPVSEQACRSTYSNFPHPAQGLKSGRCNLQGVPGQYIQLAWLLISSSSLLLLLDLRPHPYTAQLALLREGLGHGLSSWATIISRAGTIHWLLLPASCP